jgi:hypothetical protein
MVSARRRNHADGRYRAREHLVERAARLERSGVLQVFELEDEANPGEPEIDAVDLDHRRAANVRRDARGRGADRLAREPVRNRRHASDG